jgi:hypothetical protein
MVTPFFPARVSSRRRNFFNQARVRRSTALARAANRTYHLGLGRTGTTQRLPKV